MENKRTTLLKNQMGNIGKIFIIDDDSIFRFVILRHLEVLLPESQVFIFEDGQSALTDIQEASPDIIFLDLFMPILDGWAFLAELKKIGVPYNLIAYIVITSLDNFDKKDIDKYPFVKGFITKPFTKTDLEKIIEDYTNEYLSVNF